MSDLFEMMRLSVLEGDEDEAGKLAKKVLDEGIDPVEAMEAGFLKGIREAGKLYEDGEYYLPELVCSADAMKCALSILDEKIKNGEDKLKNKGLIVLATVKGDVHDIGKTIVGAMMTAAGYEVHDLGSDVPNCDVISSIRELKANAVGLSALLTTTMEEQLNIVKMLENEGMRNEVKVFVGGAPVSREWCTKIGADGFSDSAAGAVKLADEMLL